MEKKEKIEVKTSVSYYSYLFTLLRGDKNSFVVSTEDIYHEIKNLNDMIGIETNPKMKLITKNQFIKIFSKYIKESIKDTSYTGKGTREIYSLEIKPSDIVGLELKILKDFPRLKRKFRNDKSKSTDTEKVVTEKKTVVKESKPKSIIPGKNLPRRDFLFRFFELLKVANTTTTGRVNKKQIKSVMQLKNIPSMGGLIDAWKSTLVRGGIYANFTLYETDRRELEISISNISGLIDVIGKKYKSWFGIDLKTDEVLKITTSMKPIEKVFIQPKTADTVPFSIAYTIFAIGGICKDRKSLVNYEVIYKLLKENFNIKISRNETIDLVRKYAAEYLEISNQGAGGVILKKTSDWESFNEKFSPRNFKETAYARIGMTLDEIKDLVPNFEVEVVTKFTECDAVYKIVYDKSIHSLKNLCNLYRTFRGSDKFFEDGLTKILQDEIEYVDSRSYVGNLAYEIEV